MAKVVRYSVIICEIRLNCRKATLTTSRTPELLLGVSFLFSQYIVSVLALRVRNKQGGEGALELLFMFKIIVK